MANNIKKIQVKGVTVYPATVLDAVKDAKTGSSTYGKTVREIIEDNEKVTSEALTELNGRVGKLTDLKTTEKGSIVSAINEILTAAGVTKFGEKTGAITLKAESSTNGDVNLKMSDNELLASIVGLKAGAFAEISTALPESEDKCSDSKVVSEKLLYNAGMSILDTVTGTSDTQPDGTNETLTSIDERVDAIETTLNVAGTDQATIDRVDEVLTWFSGVQESDPQGAAVITAAAAVGTKGSGDTASTGLIKDVEDLQKRSNVTVTSTAVSDGTNTLTKTTVIKGTGNGTISVDGGSDITIYTLPTDVVKDSSYVHTDNNYTTDEKNKLAGIAEGAEKNAEGTVVDSAYSHITVSSTGVSDTKGNTYSFAESDVTIASASTNYATASKHEVTIVTSAVSSTATGLASAAGVYEYALTAVATSDTTDYADVFTTTA